MHRSAPRPPKRALWIAALILPVALAFPHSATAQQAAQPTPTFTSAQEAHKVGLAYVRSKNLVQGREALEQALKLNPDANLKYRIHEGLAEVYQTLPDPEPMVGTVDFLLRNADGPAQVLNARRRLLNYAVKHKNGAAIAPRFEKILTSQPLDRPALIVVSALCAEALKQPKRGGELTDTLLGEFRKQYNNKVPTGVLSDYAQQYGKCERHREAAALWEELIAADNHLRSWYAKELAVSWLAAGEKEKALAAARSAAALPADDRGAILTHFWHRHLGDVFLATKDYGQAIIQFEKAIAATEIQGYKQECQKKLEEARKAASA